MTANQLRGAHSRTTRDYMPSRQTLVAQFLMLASGVNTTLSPLLMSRIDSPQQSPLRHATKFRSSLMSHLTTLFVTIVRLRESSSPKMQRNASVRASARRLNNTGANQSPHRHTPQRIMALQSGSTELYRKHFVQCSTPLIFMATIGRWCCKTLSTSIICGSIHQPMLFLSISG